MTSLSREQSNLLFSSIIFFILFLLPFVVLPFGNSQFELPKVFVFEYLNVFLFFLFIIRKQNTPSFFDKTQLILFGSLLLLTLLDLAFLRTNLTLFGNNVRLQGIFLLWNLLFFSLLSSRIELRKISAYFFPLSLLATFILSLCIGNSQARAIATIGEPNALAAYVIFLWPFAFYSEISKYKIPIRLLVLALTIGTILLTGSRSGLIAFAIEIILLVSTKIIKLKLKSALFIGIILLLLSYSLPFLTHTLYEDRQEIWNSASISISSRPLFGWGFGNTEIALKQSSIKLYDRLRGYYVDSSHNIFLDLGVQGGFIGLSIFVLILYFAFKNFLTKKLEFELIILLGLITSLSFNPASIVNLIAFWWIIGRGFAMKKS